MTALSNLTVADLEKMIRDTVKKVDADAAAERMQRDHETGQKAFQDGGLEALVRLAREATAPARAVIKDGVVISDPHKGKGLRAARFIRCAALATESKRDLAVVAEGISQRDDLSESERGGYADVAKLAKERALQSNVFTGAGVLIPPELAAELIELLYARTVVLALGARTMEFSSSISMGRINSGATVSYVGELANIVPSQPGFGELRMTGRKASALVPVTNELLRNPSVSADTIIRDDLLQALALKRDLSALRGTGDTYQPKGLKNVINSSNVFASTGTTTAQKVADITKAVRLVDESNIPLDSGGWAVSPRTKWGLFATLDANSNFVFAAQLAAGSLLGFPLRTTTQIPNNLGGGSDSEVYFGAWNDMVIGFDRVTPMQVQAFENGAYHDGSAVVSGISNDSTPVRLLEGHDIVIRHDNTFSQVTGVQWQ